MAATKRPKPAKPQKSILSPWKPKDVTTVKSTVSKPAIASLEGHEIKFTVYHKPMGAPRMNRADRWKQRPCVMRYREFKDAIRSAVPCSLPRPEQVADLSWVAYFVPAKSHSTKKRLAMLDTLHRVKPDRDNIDKAVLDALFENDQAIASGMIVKRWGREEKIEITITLI